jgi:import inner membrane translocase subunit TIM23
MSSIWSRWTGRKGTAETDQQQQEQKVAFDEKTSSDATSVSAPDPFWAVVDESDALPDIEDRGPPIDFSNLDRIQAETVAPALGIYAPLGRRSGDVDYLFAEEYHDYRHKSWGEQLTFWAGVSYLSGAIIGGSMGLREGIQKGNEMVAEMVSPAAERGVGSASTASLSVSTASKAKLRANALLNAVGRRAGRLGNAAGIVAILFSGFESFLHWFRDDVDDAWNYVGAGALAGAIYKSTAGLRVVSLWSTGLATVGLVGLYGARRGIYGRRVRQLL